jgi:hypothetical protein
MATIVWTGNAGDGNWNTPGNWSPAQVPGVSDTVTISPTALTAIAVGGNAVGALTTDNFVTLNVGNNSSFSFGSAAGGATTFSNGGTFALNSTANTTELIVGAPTLTLTGGGVVSLSNNINNYIVGAAASDVLINTNNTIEGAGQLGNGGLNLTNGTAGVIDASLGTSLVLNTGGNVTSNSGLIEGTGTGGLVIVSAVNNGAAGKITAATGNVYLSGGTLEGGTLATSGGGEIIDSSGGTLNGVTNAVVNTGTVFVDNNNGLHVTGTIDNTGTVELASVANTTQFLLDAAVTLTGSGTLLLSNNTQNYIEGTGGAANTLDNVNNLITGAGQIGNGTLTFVNGSAGVVNASDTTDLVLNTGTVTATNSGLLESTNTGGLYLETTVNNGTAGKITAAGGNVYLYGGTVQGGTLATSGGADFVESNGGTLDGSAVTVTNTGTVILVNNTGLDLLGTMTNSGTISLQSTANTTSLVAGPTTGTTAGTATLTGKGVVALSDNSQNYVRAGIAGDTLVNLNNTISGAGTFTSGLTLVNDAVIDSNAGTNALVFAGGAVVTNNGTLEATVANDGGLVISTTISNSAGTILATAGNVYLASGTIVGGLIKTTGAGELVDTSSGTLNGAASAVTNQGTIYVDNNDNVHVLGSIVNDGTIVLGSTANATDIIIDSATLTLSGAGTVSLSNNANNFIYASTATDVLDNVNNVIEGAGQLGNGSLTLVNTANGLIDANLATSLTLNTGAAAVTNSGTIEATGAGGLNIVNTNVNDSSGGSLLAAGGNIYLQGGTISGGVINSSGKAAIVNASGGLLNGSTQAVTNLGSVAINNNTTLGISGTITNEGTIGVNSNANATSLEITSASLTLNGGGQIVLSGQYQQ